SAVESIRRPRAAGAAAPPREDTHAAHAEARGRAAMSQAITDLATAGPLDTAERSPAESQADRAVAEAEPFARLYRALLPPVLGYVRYRIGDRQAAEDVTAQVFERALARLATVRDPDKVRAWVFGIARNAVADYRRRRRDTAALDAVE